MGSSGSSSGQPLASTTAPLPGNMTSLPSSAKPVTRYDSSASNQPRSSPRIQEATSANVARPLTAFGTSREVINQEHNTRVWRSREWSDWTPPYSQQQQWEWTNWSSTSQSSGSTSQASYPQSARQALLNAVGRQTREFAERLPEAVLAGILLSTSASHITNRPSYFATAVRRAAADRGWF